MNRMSRNKTKNHYGFINTLELLKSYGENWREFQKWVDGGGGGGGGAGGGMAPADSRVSGPNVERTGCSFQIQSPSSEPS